MIKAIVLDLDGVYYKKGGLWPYVKWLMKETGKTDEELHVIFHKNEYFDAWQKGQISENQYWDLVEEALGKKIERERYIAKVAEGFVKDEELITLVLNLKEKGIKFGICSNTNLSTTTSRKLLGKDPKGYDFQILSFEVGLRKPDKKIFEIVVKEAGCEPSEIVYADDNPKTLPEAKEMGINTYVYDNVENFKKFLEELGVQI